MGQTVCAQVERVSVRSQPLGAAAVAAQVGASLAQPAVPAAPLMPAIEAPAAPILADLNIRAAAIAQSAEAAKPAETQKQLDLLFGELVRAPSLSRYDNNSVTRALESGNRLIYGATLKTLNPTTAATLASNRGLSTLTIDAAAAERGQISPIVMAVQNTAMMILGRFKSASDPFLKPKIDEGLHGAILEKTRSLKEAVKFLRRLYVPPLGRRTMGPSDVTGYLTRFQEYIDKNNDLIVGGVSIGDAEGVRKIGSIVKAKARGLRLIEVDSKGIAASLGVAEGAQAHVQALAAVESAARKAGIALSMKAASRTEALALAARGYRHVVLGSDTGAVDAAFKKFADVPLDSSKEIAPGQTGSLKTWLKDRKMIHLGFLNTPDLLFAQKMAAQSSALWIDAEHGQFSLDSIKKIIGALPSSTPAVVRTTQYDNPDIAAYLAVGAKGVVAANVNNAGQARRFVESIKKINPDALAIVMVETRAGLTNVEEIARVPGLDVVFVGPYDLGLSLGVEEGSPIHNAAVARIEAAARAAGVALGGLVKTRSRSYQLRELGYGFLATVSDQQAVTKHFRALLDSSGIPQDLKNVYKELPGAALARIADDPLAAALKAADIRLWTLRHGESESNRAGLLAGRKTNSPLTVQPNANGISGELQARVAARKMYENLGGDRWAQEVVSGSREPIVILFSPLFRAQQSADALRTLLEDKQKALGGGRLYEARALQGLEEMNYGELDGVALSEAKKWPSWPNWDGIAGAGRDFLSRFPGGESRWDVLLRQREVLRGIIEKYRGRTVIAFAHFETVTAQKAILGLLNANGSDRAMRVGPVANAEPIELSPK